MNAGSLTKEGEGMTSTWLAMRSLLARALVCASNAIEELLCQCRFTPAGGDMKRRGATEMYCRAGYVRLVQC